MQNPAVRAQAECQVHHRHQQEAEGAPACGSRDRAHCPGGSSQLLHRPGAPPSYKHPLEASGWEPDVVQGRHPLSGGQSSCSQDIRHFLTLGSNPKGRLGGAPRGGIPAGIPTPTAQFVHFLPWLQISTISLTGHLRPLPAAWPCTDPGRGQDGPCPASSKFGTGHAFNQHPAERPLAARRGARPECRGDQGLTPTVHPLATAPAVGPCGAGAGVPPRLETPAREGTHRGWAC